MPGRFLELAAPSEDLQDSLAFWEALGFRQADVGEARAYPYAVVADGRLALGLHAALDEPVLVFLRPDLGSWALSLADAGIEFEHLAIEPDSFNEARLRGPDGTLAGVVEARTYSPPPLERDSASLCGYFREYALPVGSLACAQAFWEDLGLVEGWRGEPPDAWCRLSGSGINLGLYPRAWLRAPGLVFVAPDMSERLDAIAEATGGLLPAAHLPALPGAVGALRGPEGVTLYLLEATD